MHLYCAVQRALVDISSILVLVINEALGQQNSCKSVGVSSLCRYDSRQELNCFDCVSLVLDIFFIREKSPLSFVKLFIDLEFSFIQKLSVLEAFLCHRFSSMVEYDLHEASFFLEDDTGAAVIQLIKACVCVGIQFEGEWLNLTINHVDHCPIVPHLV